MIDIEPMQVVINLILAVAKYLYDMEREGRVQCR